MRGFRPNWREVVIWSWRGLGGALAVGAMETAALLGERPLALIPFATSIVVVLGMPEADPAQPRNLIGGHAVSTMAGLLMLAVFGSSMPVAAASVGAAMLFMRLTRTMHPPAAIDPILVVLEGFGLRFLFDPVISGALLLAAFAFVWHNVAERGSWPRRWL